MVLVVIYLAIAFEWRMAVAALVALIHDLTITVGVYALVGFEVTPGTVIGLLTILGYSLYDTVVVFDSLKEAVEGRSPSRVAGPTARSPTARINGTLVRSINTTVVALLPVAGLLFIGGGFLGAGMLNDISLVALRRPRRRCVLLDLHRHAARRRPEGTRPADQGAGEAGARQAGRRCRQGASRRTSPRTPTRRTARRTRLPAEAGARRCGRAARAAARGRGRSSGRRR